MSRLTITLALACVATGAFTRTAAAGSTVGLEWEMPRVFVAASTTDPVFRQKSDDDAPAPQVFASLPDKPKGILCTNDKVVVNGTTHPYVIASRDLGNDYNLYILELITAPLDYDGSEITQAIAQAGTLLTALEQACTPDRVGDDGRCFVPVDTLLAKLPNWKKCDPSPTVPSGATLYVGTMAGWKTVEADTQVNLGVDLGRLAERSLYTPGTFAKDLRDRVLTVIDDQASKQQLKLSRDLRAFLALVYSGANLEKVAREKGFIGTEAWRIKNLYDLFPKAKPSEIFRALSPGDQTMARTMMRALHSRLIDLCYWQFYSTSVTAQFYCGDYHAYDGTPPKSSEWKRNALAWEAGALTGDEPLSYETISNPLSPFTTALGLTIVLESRLHENRLNTALALHYDPSGRTWSIPDWKGATDLLRAYFAP